MSRIPQGDSKESGGDTTSAKDEEMLAGDFENVAFVLEVLCLSGHLSAVLVSLVAWVSSQLCGASPYDLTPFGNIFKRANEP
jgi:hypothetical protein